MLRRDIKQEYWAIATMEDKIQLYSTAQAINNHEGMYTWLENAIYLQLRPSTSSINSFNKPIGMFRIRSFRSKPKSCFVSIPDNVLGTGTGTYNCYETQFGSESNS